VSSSPEPARDSVDSPKSRVDEMVESARSSLRRVSPHEAARLWASGGLLVDTRPASQRSEFGEIPGAIVIQAGYASSLAAASLRQLGLSRATDLIGGFEAWAEAGLPTRPQRAAEAPMGSAPAR
jgi:hypothetical protein